MRAIGKLSGNIHIVGVHFLHDKIEKFLNEFISNYLRINIRDNVRGYITEVHPVKKEDYSYTRMILMFENLNDTDILTSHNMLAIYIEDRVGEKLSYSIYKLYRNAECFAEFKTNFGYCSEEYGGAFKSQLERIRAHKMSVFYENLRSFCLRISSTVDDGEFANKLYDMYEDYTEKKMKWMGQDVL